MFPLFIVCFLKYSFIQWLFPHEAFKLENTQYWIFTADISEQRSSHINISGDVLYYRHRKDP